MGIADYNLSGADIHLGGRSGEGSGRVRGGCEVTREEAFSRDLSFSLSGVERTITMRMDEGCKYYPDVDTEIDEVNEDVYSISGDDPLSASAICQRSCKITYQVII